MSSDEIHTFAKEGRVRLATNGKVNKKKAEAVEPEIQPPNQLTIKFYEKKKKFLPFPWSWPWS